MDFSDLQFMGKKIRLSRLRCGASHKPFSILKLKSQIWELSFREKPKKVIRSSQRIKILKFPIVKILESQKLLKDFAIISLFDLNQNFRDSFREKSKSYKKLLKIQKVGFSKGHAFSVKKIGIAVYAGELFTR